MSVYASSTLQRRKAPSTTRGRLLAVLASATLGFSSLGACGTSGDSGGNGNPGSSGSGSSGSGSGGNSGSSGGSGGNSGGSSGGHSSSGSGSGGSSGGSSGASSGSGSGSGSSSGVTDGGGGDSTVPPGDGGPPACTNTDRTVINIDSSGWVCNNQWNIQGAWYCFSDTAGSSTSCPGGTAGVGVIPFNTTSNAMCLSGTTAATMPSATAFGAAIGVELGHAVRDAGKGAFNATTQNILGFAITISGDTGGSILNINFPPAQTTSGEAPGVAVPGLASGSSPITYNALFADAIMSDNTAAPIPKVVNAANITDVQVKIDVDGIAHPYNFCITKIVPIIAAPTPPGSLTTFGPTFNEGKQIVITGIGPYGIQNDPFNVGSDPMTMRASFGGGQVGFTATPNFSSGSVGAFPSIAYGWVHGGNFVGSGAGAYAGGKTINGTNKLTSTTSSWSFTTGSGNWDAAYDCWFGGNSNSINAGSELMIWLARNGVNPIGNQNTPVTITGATGTWTFSTGTNTTNQPVVSYVSSANMTSVTGFNLLPFFLDAANNGRAGLNGNSFLLGCQAGFELYNQGTWTTNSYSMSAQ